MKYILAGCAQLSLPMIVGYIGGHPPGSRAP